MPKLQESLSGLAARTSSNLNTLHISSSERELVEQMQGLPPALVSRSDTTMAFGIENKVLTDRQRCLAHVLHSIPAQVLLGLLIFLNLCLVIWQTNLSVEKEDLPLWGLVLDKCVLLTFIVELILRIYIMRVTFFKEFLNLLDILVIVIDVVLEVMSLAQMDNTLSAASFLRVVRLARVTRAYRVMLMLPKLAGMVRDLAGAMEAVMWGCLLLFMVMTIWSILTVQLIHPLVQDLTEEGVFDGCDRCKRAYSSVMNANLTYFQQIIAGDSWGLVTIPIMEAYPWTALLFVPVLITISLAIMNVILAVIVESAEETRREDLVERMKIKEKLFMSKSKRLVRVCASLDHDGSGDLTYEELIRGFSEQKELAMILHDMGIEEDDLATIFQIMDSDNSGTVDYKEFVHHIHKMRTADETTILNFIRHYVMEILRKVRAVEAQHPSSPEHINAERPKADDAGDAVKTAVPCTGPGNEVSIAAANEFRDMCNQMMARLDNDILAALSDISRKCELQASLLADFCKSPPSVANGHAPVRVASVPSSPPEEMTPPTFIAPPPAYACVLSNCTLERIPRPRPLPKQRLPTGEPFDLQSNLPVV
mmetsp:Transcript_47528/g.87136  ORF Transcript_47528/g.87136 Transcript_47528/m.87136 type:complete len:594 (+) Transcript_47528:50-1831(+)